MGTQSDFLVSLVNTVGNVNFEKAWKHPDPLLKDLQNKKCSSQGEGGTLAEASSLYRFSDLFQANFF